MTSTLPPWAEYFLMPALNMVVALVGVGAVIAFVGEDPLRAILVIGRGVFGQGEGLAYALFYATSFVFTGLSVSIALQAGLFNIGAEGQAYVGGLGAALACLALDKYASAWLVIPAAIGSAAVFGSAWAALPGFLQARRGSHIVITTLMFNFIAANLMAYLLTNFIREPQAMQVESRSFVADSTRLPRINGLFELFQSHYENAPLNLMFIVSLGAAVGVWFLIWRTRFGYCLRVVGANPKAAAYAGLPVKRILVMSMLMSGGLAGLMAVNVVLGDQGRLVLQLAGGAGFVGVAVALMGRLKPLGVIFAAALFGILQQGGAELAFEMPSVTREVIVLAQGIVVLMAGGLEQLFKPWLSRALSWHGSISKSVDTGTT